MNLTTVYPLAQVRRELIRTVQPLTLVVNYLPPVRT